MAGPRFGVPLEDACSVVLKEGKREGEGPGGRAL